MAGGELLIGAVAAGAGVAAIMAAKRRVAAQHRYPLPEPSAYKGAVPAQIPVTAQGGAAYLVKSGNIVRNLDMTRVTHAGAVTPHWGLDIGAEIGTPVYAPVSGRVIHAGPQNGYGRAVHLRHLTGNTSTVYAHLNEILVNDGDLVPAGAIIGKVGRSSAGPDGVVPAWGRTMQAHLHFELHPRPVPAFGETVQRSDPIPWLQSIGTALSETPRGTGLAGYGGVLGGGMFR